MVPAPRAYSTVTLFARLRGWSTLQPRIITTVGTSDEWRRRLTFALGELQEPRVIPWVVDTLFASRLLDPDLAPAAIDKAFRLYMLPQGMFSVAVATVLFPTLSRFAARGDLEGLRGTMSTGIRQIGRITATIPANGFRHAKIGQSKSVAALIGLARIDTSLVLGAVLILFVLLVPSGVIPTLRKLWLGRRGASA